MPLGIVGFGLAAIGVVLILFRVPLSAMAREARERRGQDGRSQTPLLFLFVGVWFTFFGLLIGVGSFAGWVHWS